MIYKSANDVDFVFVKLIQHWNFKDKTLFIYKKQIFYRLKS